MRLAGQVLITLITWRSHVSGSIPLSFAATDQAVHHCRTIARHLKVRSRQQANEVKMGLLHVSSETLERYGAVSEEKVGN